MGQQANKNQISNTTLRVAGWMRWALPCVAIIGGLAGFLIRDCSIATPSPRPPQSIVNPHLPKAEALALPASEFQFTDITAESGLGDYLNNALVHAIAWGDVNKDGKVDLFFGNFNGSMAMPSRGLHCSRPNAVWLQKSGKFSHWPCDALEIFARCGSAVLADLDNDGDLDLFATSRRRSSKALFPNPAFQEPSNLYELVPWRKRFLPQGPSCGACPPDAYCAREVVCFDYNQDGLLDLYITEDRYPNPNPKCRLYKNLGNLKFKNVTQEVGLPEAMNGFGVAVADVNQDHYPDLFVADANRLFLSNGRGGYREALELQNTLKLPVEEGKTCITTAAVWGDIDNDGDMDLLLGTHYSNTDSPIAIFLNEGLKEGIPQLKNVTKEILGITSLPNKPANCAIADFNNDGLPDLYWSVAVGVGDQRSLFICKGLGIRDGLPRFEIPTLPKLSIPLTRSNKTSLKEYSLLYYVTGPPVDYDDDGDLDIVAGIFPPECSKVFRNDTNETYRSLAVSVQGKKMNRMGIGAKLWVHTPDKTSLLGYGEITMSGGYAGSKPPVAHFGLKLNSKVLVIVEFPGGKRLEKLVELNARRTSIRFVEP